MSSKYVAPAMRNQTAKPVLVVVEPVPQGKYVPPSKRAETSATSPISAIMTSLTSFPSLGSAASSPTAQAPKMNYLQKIQDAEAAREDEPMSNEALEREGWRILNMSLDTLKSNLSTWYERVFYEETLPF